MKKQPLFKIGFNDLLKGFIISILTILLTGLITSLNAGKLPNYEELKSLLLIGLASGISYLLKNFLTNENDQFLKK